MLVIIIRCCPMQLTARGRFPELMRELQEMLQRTKEVLQRLPLPVSKDPVLDFTVLMFKVRPPTVPAACHHADVLQVRQTWSDMWATVRDRMPLLRTPDCPHGPHSPGSGPLLHASSPLHALRPCPAPFFVHPDTYPRVPCHSYWGAACESTLHLLLHFSSRYAAKV